MGGKILEDYVSDEEPTVPSEHAPLPVETSLSKKPLHLLRQCSTTSNISKSSRESFAQRGSRRGLTFEDINVQGALDFACGGASLSKPCRLSKRRSVSRMYFIDQENHYLRWEPSRKMRHAKIPLSEVHDVYPKPAKSDSDKALHFEAVTNRGTKTFAASTEEECKLWVTALQTALSEQEGWHQQASLIRRMFNEADVNSDGRIGLQEIKDFFLRGLNKAAKGHHLKAVLKNFDTDGNGELDEGEFASLWMDTFSMNGLKVYFQNAPSSDHSSTGPDINAEHSPCMSWAALRRFLIEHQGHDERITESEIAGPLVRFFPEQMLHPKRIGISEVGFSALLCSRDNTILDPVKLRMQQDMRKPLSHYWISCSHNTYLEGAQVAGKSSVQQYIRILRQGCRCVEIDCWDGPNGDPVVTHGYTLTSKISFQDVIQACKDHGFTQSQYPLILSLEMHCSNEQKCRIAEILTCTLGDMLLLHPPAGHKSANLISPKEGKCKVLVKAKLVAQDLEDSGSDDEENYLLNAAGQRMRVGKQSEDGPRLYYCGRSFKKENCNGQFGMNDSIDSEESLCEIPSGWSEDMMCICAPVEDSQCPDCKHAQRQLMMAAQIYEKSKSDLKITRSLSQALDVTKTKSKKAFTWALRMRKLFPRCTRAWASVCTKASKSGKQKHDRGNTQELVRRDSSKRSSGSTRSGMSGKPRKSRSKKRRMSRSSVSGFLGRRSSGSTFDLQDKAVAKGLAEYNRCIYLVGSHVKKLGEDRCPCEISSWSEGKSCKFAKNHGKELNEHHRDNLSRIYPPGTNINSKNLDPMVHWLHGCQLVALNYQITDIGTILNQAIFSNYNKGSGYVLKPACVLPGVGASGSSPQRPLHVWLLVISAHFLPKPLGTVKGDIIDPWVSVKVHGAAKDQARFDTAMIEDNGFDPEWNQVFQFTIHESDVAILSFEVFDKDLVASKLVAAAAFPISLMRSGVRWVPLWDARLKKLQDAGILVHIKTNLGEAVGEAKPDGNADAAGTLQASQSSEVDDGELDSVISQERAAGDWMPSSWSSVRLSL